MPIDYKKYPDNWTDEIRPDILMRDGHKCKFCGVPNYLVVFRGLLGSVEVYQTADGTIYSAQNSEILGRDFDGDVQPLHGDPNQQAIKVVLTIAHLDHDIQNNDYANLAALCQRCHNRYDHPTRRANAKKTTTRKKGLQDIFKTP